MIGAEVHSDDHVAEVSFDATEWFEQATNSDILALRKIGWGGDYAADVVAQFFSLDDDVEHLFWYVRAHDDIGYECHVDADDALEWIRQNRTSLWLCIRVSEEVS